MEELEDGSQPTNYLKGIYVRRGPTVYMRPYRYESTLLCLRARQLTYVPVVGEGFQEAMNDRRFARKTECLQIQAESFVYTEALKGERTVE